MDENINLDENLSRKSRKINEKIEKLEEKNKTKHSKRIDKKIAKLVKKRERHENWLKIKLPFRILIKLCSIWIVIALISYSFTFIPLLKEAKVATMAAVAYVAPSEVTKVLDVVTINFGAKKSDYSWLKNTMNDYLNKEKELEIDEDFKVTDEKVVEENEEKISSIAKDVLGTNDTDKISSMPVQEILTKAAKNATPEMVSEAVDATPLTSESKEMLKNDINKALKIISKLNGSQMDELVETIKSKMYD